MNELQEELKFFIKEVRLYHDWVDLFVGLVKIRSSLEKTYFLDCPDYDIEGTLNKLKSLLGQREPFKTNSETCFTEDVSKSFKEEQPELGSSSGRETWEEDAKISGKITDSLPLVSSFDCTKHQVDPTNLDCIVIDGYCYDKKCTRESVTGIYALLDIFEITEENSLPFEEAVTSLRSSLDNLDSYDDIKISKDITKDIEKIVSLSPHHEQHYSKEPFYKDTLNIGVYLTKVTREAKANEILDLVLEIDKKQSDLSVSAEVEMVLSLIPALTPIEQYICFVRFSYPCRPYSTIIQKLNALEIIFMAYCKHQNSITSMKQEDVSLEYKKIADSIALLKTLDKKMCAHSDSDSDVYSHDSDSEYHSD